jgi:hypothetical protein
VWNFHVMKKDEVVRGDWGTAVLEIQVSVIRAEMCGIFMSLLLLGNECLWGMVGLGDDMLGVGLHGGLNYRA